ncbi:hypothetical protein BT96DRAFT_1010451 [Gymnopus androsaceus JB14]|uniref:Uncharacterized protein n=1 Tax=Gymnopus androsaceus JB14 TaxID=1447944 RepID=A0A6A4GAR0_9AGAR|nr:hypothetical protein BT96DRAFT_1010451 [Gymnopus androsaceus JB14]
MAKAEEAARLIAATECSSTSSTPLPSKCATSKEPPTTLSPPKCQATPTACGMTGGKPPEKILPSNAPS